MMDVQRRIKGIMNLVLRSSYSGEMVLQSSLRLQKSSSDGVDIEIPSSQVYFPGVFILFISNECHQHLPMHTNEHLVVPSSDTAPAFTQST